MKARLAIATTLAVLTALVLTATASASEPLEDGEYSITLPGSGEIVFTVSDDGEMLTVDSMPAGFEVTEDDSSDGDTTKITGDGVTVEIETGDDGKIEVDGVSFAEETTVSALLPGVDGAVGITIDGDVVDVSAPEPFKVVDTDTDPDEVEVYLSDGERTFEIEVDLEDGSVEIKLADDDSSSDDSASDDMESEDDESEDSESEEDSTVDSVLDDSLSEDDESDDDDSSDDSAVGSKDETTDSAVGSTTDTTIDDDDNSSDDDESKNEVTEDTKPSDDSDDESEDDKSDDDDSSD